MEKTLFQIKNLSFSYGVMLCLMIFLLKFRKDFLFLGPSGSGKNIAEYFNRKKYS